MEVINKIRDILRTEGIASRKSFNYCVAFIIIRLFDKKICQKLNIEFTFDELCNLDKDRLYENISKLIPYLVYNLNMNFLRNFKLSPDNLYKIFTLLRTLNPHKLNEKYDLIGTLYELHIKTGSNNGRDLGQFFTNRLVIEYMINLVEPQLNETICDPTMGTGGFLTMAVKYLNNKYNVNWSQYKNLIFGYDIDSDVKDLAFLNLFLETGEKFTTLYQQDVLTQGLKHKYKIILANEPMGVKSLYNLCCENIKQLGIKTNKCESLFLQLFSRHLDLDGKCCVIVPDGFLFSQYHLQTRSWLINNFNLKKVISLDGEFFINTNIKTSIIYFINNGKTTNIEFCKLSTDLKENKITTVTINNLTSDYNLIYKNYISNDLYHNLKFYKLNDICTFLPKSKRNASYGKNIGLYPFFCSSKKIKYCDNYDYDTESIIIGTGGFANIKFGTKFSCSNHNEVITSKDNNILNKYIYYYLENNIDILEKGFHGSCIKNLSKEYIKNISIPFVNLDTQVKIIKTLDLISDSITISNKLIHLYKKQIKYLIFTSTQHKDKNKLSNLCDLKRGSNFVQSTNGYRIIQITNIKDGKITFLDKDVYTQKLKNNYILNKDEFIISLVGTVGKIGIYEKDDKVVYNDRTAKFINFNSQVLPKYLYYYLRQKEDLIKNKASRTCQPIITPKCILSLNIPLISKDDQQKLIFYCDKIVTLVDKLDKNVKFNEQKTKLIVQKELK
ncbi:MAG: N-6 DNA methylase [Candidatus Micrarchaeaceae archaeon]